MKPHEHCWACVGRGEVMAFSWESATGHKPCTECKGTGYGESLETYWKRNGIKPHVNAPSCSPKTTTVALQCHQRLTQPTPAQALQDACRKATLAVIADLTEKGKLMLPRSDIMNEVQAITHQKPIFDKQRQGDR